MTHLSQILSEQLENQRQEIRRLEAKNTTLMELVDGVSPLVETYKAESLACLVWKQDWLKKAREALR